MKKQSLFFCSRYYPDWYFLADSFYCFTHYFGRYFARAGSRSQFAWCLDQPSSPHVYPLFAIFYPTGSKNRLGASLYLQPLLLDHWITYSTNQSAPALFRNFDGWGKYRSHQCAASQSYPSQSTKEDWFSDHLICNLYGDCDGFGFLSSRAHYTSQFLERPHHPPHPALSSNFFGLAAKSPL